MTKPNAILKPHEVAKMLRIHINTVYIMAANGSIPAFRIGKLGKLWRFNRDAIDKIVKTGELQIENTNLDTSDS